MSMREVAKLSGVSVGAVSKAFHNHPSVPARTRDKILNAAAQLGYTPNPELSHVMHLVARARAGKEKPTIAVLFPWSQKNNLIGRAGDPTLQMVWRGLEATANKMGYRLEPFWLADSGVTLERLFCVLKARGLKALILFSCPAAYSQLNLDLSALSCVAIGHIRQSHPPITVDVDAFESSFLVMKNLLEMGYKAPGNVIIDQTVEQDDGRFQATLDYHKSKYFAAAGSIPDFLMTTRHDQPWSQPDTREIARLGKWIQTHKPDVVISHYNEVRSWIEGSGFAVPSQIGFVSLNNPAHGDNAGISFDWEFVGTKAMVLMDQLLAKHIHGSPRYSEHFLIGPQWTPGTSLISQMKGSHQSKSKR